MKRVRKRSFKQDINFRRLRGNGQLHHIEGTLKSIRNDVPLTTTEYLDLGLIISSVGNVISNWKKNCHKALENATKLHEGELPI